MVWGAGIEEVGDSQQRCLRDPSQTYEDTVKE